MEPQGNTFLLRQQQSAFKNCLLVKCSTLMPFLADSVLFSRLPLCLSPLSCINLSMLNQCFFISERERERRGKTSLLLHIDCVAEYLSSTKGYLDFNIFTHVTNIDWYLLLKSNYHLSSHEAFKYPPLKVFLFNPSQWEEKMFDVGVVSSQSSLDHWSHICKSCLMNNVCVKSVC